MLEEAVLIGLAAWRMTRLICYETGPFDLLLRFRKLLGFEHNEEGSPVAWPNGLLPNLFACPWCLGLWISIGGYFVWREEPAVVMVGAAAGVVALIEDSLRWRNK